ncbi:helix-turn-helix transcriptional regulator [Gilvimarinus agarilyticus]|uniref:helix-turn-helix transcriptional regulator n=1 Tax=Gilvimarinus agarilyticus TaxID=679259 RepID=UPI0006974676|nr:helix-turn-helix transcriptional regulator [Gilvimarinus agarilyticus]
MSQTVQLLPDINSDIAIPVWDTLASYCSSKNEEALHYLLSQLIRLTGASSGYWLGVTRVDSQHLNDPLNGWRPRKIVRLEPDGERDQHFRKIVARVNNSVDPSIAYHTQRTGRFRACSQSDITKVTGTGEHFQTKQDMFNVSDALFITTPIGDDIESYIVLERHLPAGIFSREQLADAAHVLRGLKWFQRRLILSYGIHLPSQPLTPTERRVLHQLLTDKSEAQIATHLQQKVSTTHSYVTAIFRKFGVRGRAGLTALWLGNDQ